MVSIIVGNSEADDTLSIRIALIISCRQSSPNFRLYPRHISSGRPPMTPSELCTEVISVLNRLKMPVSVFSTADCRDDFSCAHPGRSGTVLPMKYATPPGRKNARTQSVIQSACSSSYMISEPKTTSNAKPGIHVGGSRSNFEELTMKPGNKTSNNDADLCCHHQCKVHQMQHL